MKNVFIVGAQCTGKTTLLHALKEYYAQPGNLGGETRQPILIMEVARTVLKKLDIDRDDIANSPERCLRLQQAILDAQHNVEQDSNASPDSWYISDRSGIDPIVYTRMLVGEPAAQQLLETSAWTRLERNMKDGLVFVCEAGCSWLTDDGTRLMPRDDQAWLEFDAAFRTLLDEREINFALIPKEMESISDRVGLVASAQD